MDLKLCKGQYILYKNQDRYELGRVKEVRNNNTAFVCYHSGDTAALTSFDDIILLANDKVIVETTLGGETFYHERLE